MEVVDLDEVPEYSPVKPKFKRRTRRSLLDEVDEGENRGSEGEVDTAEEHRKAMERKRKGKTVAAPKSRKSQRISSIREEALTPPRAPSKFPGPGCPAGEHESEEESEEEEVPNFERTEIWLTRKLLTSMAKFDDPKRAQTYKDRSIVGKLAKSGKRFDLKVLEYIESEEEFMSYIKDIGFEWLLNHSDKEVPLIEAREFFSTFKLKATTNQDADAISFRLFNIEHEMSIREWSLRMGLFTTAEDDEGI